MSIKQNHVSLPELERWINTTLNIGKFKDYAPNGLQLEGSAQVGNVVTGVTASLALLQEAVKRNANTVIVHHGWFWKNENPCIVGSKRERIKLALDNNINILGYHLPLDAHPTLGNNAQLANILQLTPYTNEDGSPTTFGYSDLIWAGKCKPQTLAQLGQNIELALSRKPMVVGNSNQTIRTIAWCTGGAQGMMQEAIDYGVDAFITGEASEQNFHMANESGVAFIAAGHHATERYGVKALGEEIARHFDLNVEFVDLDNPI